LLKKTKFILKQAENKSFAKLRRKFFVEESIKQKTKVHFKILCSYITILRTKHSGSNFSEGFLEPDFMVDKITRLPILNKA
jgi:hypothetical protein